VNLKPGQFIEAYSRKLRAVEIDSTYYSIPPPHVVAGWREKTPPGFVFAGKIPGAITHEKVLKNCQPEFTTFLKNMEQLGDRLGPLLLQFPYFSRDVLPSREPFERLFKPFLRCLPADFKFALEIRNKLDQLGLSPAAARALCGIGSGGPSLDAAHRPFGQSRRSAHGRFRLRPLYR